MKVKVIDSLMGTGKTTAAINHINHTDEDTRILYITPYLTEVRRIIESCPDKRFKQPETYGSKINGIKHLFDNKCNIVSTHALFSRFDDEIIDMAYANNYILIMDEVADVIEPYEIKEADLNTLLEKYVTIQDNGIMKWIDNKYNGDKFIDEKHYCDMECLAIFGGSAMLFLFPIKTFRAFREIYILTYMFNAQTQKYYYDYYGIEYEHMYIAGDNIDNYRFTDMPVHYDLPDFSELISINDSRKLNMIGDSETALSKNWYNRNRNNKLIKQLKNATSNYFKNYTKTKSEENLWTTFKDCQHALSGKGYTKGFLSSNTRATNEFRNRTAVAYLINKYFNPNVSLFFESHGVKVDEDAYALSEMLQFIWRSAIRDGKEIQLYIPSRRMRELLIMWISDTNKQEKKSEKE